MKPHLIPIPGLKPAKPHFSELGLKFRMLHVLTPSEAEKIKFTLVDECLRIEGPRELLEKVARRLRKLGADDTKSPYWS